MLYEKLGARGGGENAHSGFSNSSTSGSDFLLLGEKKGEKAAQQHSSRLPTPLPPPNPKHSPYSHHSRAIDKGFREHHGL